MSGLGHNGGPTMEGGHGWRKHCWSKARKDLLPVLPLQIVRNRVRRAKELGLDYGTYATVRATTGRDIVAFLYSSNALDLRRAATDLPAGKEAKLRQLKSCRGLVAAHRPLDPRAVAVAFAEAGLPIEQGFAAPNLTDSWSQTRVRITEALRDGKLHPASVLMLGDTALEREWVEAGRLAAFLDAPAYFAQNL